ncbi:MAG TPA: aminopeptidase N [Actinomycetes bacterium]|nr:aminopeptidase N [Actinomycetes bacterium]
MPGENLTRDEARERAALLSVDSYSIHIDLTQGDVTFGSTSTIRFSATPGSSTFIDLIAPKAREVTLNGTKLDAASVFDGARIALSGLLEQNELTVVADAAYMHTGEGLHRFVDPVDKAVYLHTQFEVIDARRVFACFDQPDLKGTFTFSITGPSDWEIISNSPTPAPEPIGTGIARWNFSTTPRISTYITALIAGPYAAVRSEYRGIPMGVFCRQSLFEFLDAEAILDVTRRGFDYFEELFDRAYPFEKYDQLFVPEFNAGAMENAGAVTILEDYVFRSKVTDAAYERRAETILHELAHMWFGNLVTMRWWDDLWLNESFATYASILCEAEATHWTSAWTTFSNLEKTWAYRQDQLPSTHPIAADIRDIEDVLVNFDGITYAKGASVLKQLVAWVGRDQFIDGIRKYFSRHEWGNTQLADLLAVLEETSGRDLSSWAKEWLETAGLNTMRPEFSVDDAGRFTSFAVLQSAPADHPTLRSHRLGIGLYNRRDEGLIRTHHVELDVTGERTDVAELMGHEQPDLVLLNDEDLTYTKLRLDPRSATTLVESIEEFRESLPRALCWTAAWDMTRDGEIAARDFVALVRAGLGIETDIGIVQSLARQAISALYLYSDESVKEPSLQAFADFLFGLANAAEPGSDHQLALTRAFSSIARTDAQLEVLTGLLGGVELLPGLAIDKDLRWALLQRLVITGRCGPEQIDQELDQDLTASGQRQAAAARSMVGTVEAKEAAWNATVNEDELPNALLAATVSGFNQPEQIELQRAFIPRYFEMLQRVWSERTNDTAQTLVLGLFPVYVVEPETVRLTEQFISDNDLAPALRRLLLESADTVSRALRARAADTKRAAAN